MMMLRGLAPPPTTTADGRTVVAAELEALDGTLTFDVGARRAQVEAAMAFRVPVDACAAFDLRQQLRSVTLDGAPLTPAAVAHLDLGGGEGAALRVTDQPLDAGVAHRLEVAYNLETPTVEDARGIAWETGRVRFDVWCSDLAPGRYLEQWLPVSLCQDRFALSLEVMVPGTAEPHQLMANGQVVTIGDNHWRVRWPAHHTSLSCLLRVAPVRELRTATVAGVVLTADPGVDADPHRLAEHVAAWLAADTSTFGAYAHATPFLVHVWDASRGMEYDGATTGSVGSLEHEVFHSWFGRGVKPASASDGWIDEALATWWTSDHPDHPRQAAIPMPLDEEPVLLAPPNPWSRHTPRAAYGTGYRLMADAAHRGGGPARVADALAAFYRTRIGGFASTVDLQTHLQETLGIDLAPWWDRYVRGRG